MLFQDGSNLTDLIKEAKNEKRQIEKKTVQEWSLQMLDALACMHSKNLIHKKIIPKQVIIYSLINGAYNCIAPLNYFI